MATDFGPTISSGLAEGGERGPLAVRDGVDGAGRRRVGGQAGSGERGGEGPGVDAGLGEAGERGGRLRGGGRGEGGFGSAGEGVVGEGPRGEIAEVGDGTGRGEQRPRRVAAEREGRPAGEDFGRAGAQGVVEEDRPSRKRRGRRRRAA